MKRIIALENIRSGYNVGNIIRTADGLGREVRLIGYTPSPFDSPKVTKTSLGAEKSVNIQRFYTSEIFFDTAKSQHFFIISAEITENSIPLDKFSNEIKNQNKDLIVIFGNEIYGVSKFLLEKSDEIVHIPMKGIKSSFNVSQSTAIFMWELRN